MKRTVGFILIVVWALSAGPLGAGQKDPDFSKVREMIAAKMKKEGLPSMAVAVARDGRIIWEEAWGFANIEEKIPATPRTMYSLASVSKPFTATGMMVLVERGLVKLDEPANRYLGEGKLSGIRPEEATVRRLLTHTSGLSLHWNLIFADENYVRPDMDETIRRYGIIVAPPGEAFNYSNLGYGILDQIISRTSGKSYADFMASEVFGPLGLDRTAVFTAPPDSEADVAQRYGRSQKPFPFYDFDHRGASAIWSSVHDLVRFGMFHLGNRLPEQKPIISKAGVQAMQKERDPRLPSADYAQGWSSVKNAGQEFIAHAGGMYGVGARLALLPKHNVVCAVVTNASSSMSGTDLWEIEWEIFKAVVPGFPESPEIRPASPSPGFHPPEALLGTWKGTVRAGGSERPVKLTVDPAGQVRLELDGQEIRALGGQTPMGPLRYLAEDQVLIATFMGRLKTPDTDRSPHLLFLTVKWRGDRLDGTLSAIAANQRFCYPHAVAFTRREPPVRH